MNNKQFKDLIISKGVHLIGIFCGYDIVLNKKLEINIRMRKIKHKPNLKPGEIVIIEALDLTNHAKQIATDAIETTLAIYDLQEHEDKEKKINELDTQIKHQIMLIKFNIIIQLIHSITPQKQTQFYYSLGVKNAEQLTNGTDTVPNY